MARINLGTPIEERSIPRAVAAKGYLGRAILITNIWESTCVSFVNKAGYFVDDDPNEHIKRNLQPNTYVFTPVVRLCTSPQGDVVGPACKVEFLRLSPNMYNKFNEDIRRNPNFTSIELVSDSSGTYEKTVPVPVSTQFPFANEISSFISSLDVEELLMTIKSEMGAPLSVYDARLKAESHAAHQQGVAQPQGSTLPQGSTQLQGGFPSFQQPAQQVPAFQQPAPAFQQPAQQASAFQQPAQQAPAFQQPAPAFQQQAPAQQAPAQQAPAQQAPAQQAPAQQAPAQQAPAQPAQPDTAQGSFSVPTPDSAGAFNFPTFGGFTDGSAQ